MDTKMLKILLVDDDRIMQDLYSKRFKNAGFDFQGLPNADGDFLKKVTEFGPDVILMDIRFEGSAGNGVIAGEVLQTNDKTKAIPIIFFTNAETEELAQRAKVLPATIGFLVKVEYTPNEVLQKVQELYAEYKKRAKN